jgi:hypothetical protein
MTYYRTSRHDMLCWEQGTINSAGKFSQNRCISMVYLCQEKL